MAFTNVGGLPQGSTPLSLRDRLDRRWGAMERERASWIEHYRLLADYILPRRGRFMQTKANQGAQINQSIIDSTGTRAHRTLSAGLMAGLTSPARPWFRLITPDYDLNEVAPVKIWLGETERRMRQVFQSSNFYNALHTVYEELGLFGTGAMVILEDYDTVIRCETMTAGEYALAVNNRRIVDTLYRQIRMSVLQVVQTFGIENVSSTVADAYRRGAYDDWVDVMHAIEPNLDRKNGKLDNRNMPYASTYWEAFSREPDKEKFLRREGFRENALVAPRWDVVGNDVYGRSPGMDALPDVRQLQVQQKRKGQAVDKLVNPPMQASGGMRDRMVSLLPGSVTFVEDFAAGGGVKPLYEVAPDIGALREDIMATQTRVEQTFFADLFLMIATSDRREITAREIDERHEEKLLALGPVLERLQSELLGPAIDRTFAIMMRNGVLTEPPQELQGMDLQVDYISILAQAQKGVATAGLERLSAFVGNLAAVNPAVLDKLDFDQAVDEMGDMLGVPAKVVRPDDMVDAIRQERQQQEQAAQMAQMAKPVSDAATAAKTLSETEIGGGANALQVMLGGQPADSSVVLPPEDEETGPVPARAR